MNNADFLGLNSNLMGLVFCCPFFEEPCNECPFQNFVNLQIEDKIEKYNKFTDIERKQIFSKHYELFTIRSKNTSGCKPVIPKYFNQ